MKRNNFSYKLKYNGYIELIYKCSSHDTYWTDPYKNFSWRDHLHLCKCLYYSCVSDPQT